MSALALLPLLVVSAAAQVQYASDPAVRVWLEDDGEYERGDRVRVYVEAREDGYLLVLHADPEGRVRVLFPLDPGVDDFVRGRQTYEIRGRGDREAFMVDERTGDGLVLAAWSPDPFRYEGFARDNHWDYRAIAPQGVRDDPEAGLLEIVHAMSSGTFAFDAQPYIVGQPRYAHGPRYHSGVAVRLYDPWCGACLYTVYTPKPGLHVGFSIGFGYRPWWHAGVWWDPFWHHRHHWYRIGFYDPFFPWFVKPYRIYPAYWYPRYRHHYPRYAWSRWYDRGRPGLATGYFTGPLDPWGDGRDYRFGERLRAIGIADAIAFDNGRMARPRVGLAGAVIGSDGAGEGVGRLTDAGLNRNAARRSDAGTDDRAGIARAIGLPGGDDPARDPTERSAVRSGSGRDDRAGIARAIGLAGSDDAARGDRTARTTVQRSGSGRDDRSGIARAIGLPPDDDRARRSQPDGDEAHRSGSGGDGRAGIARTIGIADESRPGLRTSGDREAANRRDDGDDRPGLSRIIGGDRDRAERRSSEPSTARRSGGDRAGIARRIGIEPRAAVPDRDRSAVRSDSDRRGTLVPADRRSSGRIGDSDRSRPSSRESRPSASGRSGSGSISRSAAPSRSAPSVRSSPPARSGIGRASSGSSRGSRARPSSRSGRRIGGNR